MSSHHHAKPSGLIAPQTICSAEVPVEKGRLGFEWLIEGDDNRNATVEVSYRQTGDVEWKQGLPLLRLQGERIYQSEGVFDVIPPNMFAGSILDLEADTAHKSPASRRDWARHPEALDPLGGFQ